MVKERLADGKHHLASKAKVINGGKKKANDEKGKSPNQNRPLMPRGRKFDQGGKKGRKGSK